MSGHILFTEPTQENLAPRSLLELQALCQALVIPYTGTRAKLTDRILKAWDLRQTLKHFNNPADLASAFKATELKEMCRVARLWLGGKKHTKAAGLLNWRNECRKKGQKRLKQGMADSNRRRLLSFWGPL